MEQPRSWCSQNSSEQSCDPVLFHSISVLKIRSTPNSKWSSPQNSSEQSCDPVLFHSISVLKIRSTPNSKWSSPMLHTVLEQCSKCFRTVNGAAPRSSTHGHAWEFYDVIVNFQCVQDLCGSLISSSQSCQINAIGCG